MTIDILIEAMEMLRDRGDHPDYKEEVICKTLCELKNVKASIPNWMEAWHGMVHVIPADCAVSLQNHLLYDEFGKLAKKNEATFQNYEEIAKRTYGLEGMSWYVYRTGYEVINDLWHDNEANGCNNDDGTYCP